MDNQLEMFEFLKVSLGLGFHETLVLVLVLKFMAPILAKEGQTLSLFQVMGLAATTVEPKGYISSIRSMGPAFRKLVKRFLDFQTILKCCLKLSGVYTEPVKTLVLEPDIELFDIFQTAIVTSGTVMYASTKTRSHDCIVGSVKDWTYYALTSGLIHPMTREPIVKLGLIEHFTGSSLSSNPLQSYPPYDYTLVALTEIELNQDINFDQYYDYSYSDLVNFEAQFAIPMENRLSPYISYNQMSFSDMVLNQSIAIAMSSIDSDSIGVVLAELDYPLAAANNSMYEALNSGHAAASLPETLPAEEEEADIPSSQYGALADEYLDISAISAIDE